jgi:spore maturation protein CgeB
LRGLFRALNNDGHQIHFFERDTPYYAAHRDAESLPFAEICYYSEWDDNLSRAKQELSTADVAMVTSYCPDGIAASDLVLSSNVPRTAFYDMDTPVTLSRLERGESVEYIPTQGLAGFDLVLSYTGGQALGRLHDQLGARRASTLYGWVDPQLHYRVDSSSRFEADLSYLGTYSADRQAALEELLIEPARQLSNRQFLIAGAMYPSPEAWPRNIRHFGHVSPPEHSSFYSSSPLTLNVTRALMASMGYCPSGRLFEAAACGTAVLSDWWAGLDLFFEPGEEILISTCTRDAVFAIAKDHGLLQRIGSRARERALDCHTAEIRARRLVSLLETPRDERNEIEAESHASRGA